VSPSRRRLALTPSWSLPLWLPVALAVASLALAAAALVVAAEARVVDRGTLLAAFPDWELWRVEAFGAEVLVDGTEPALRDLLTAIGLGVLAGVGLLAAVVLRGWTRAPVRVAVAFALAGAGAAFLAADEVLNVHESIGLTFLRGVPGLTHPDDAILAGYVVVAALGAFAFRDVVRPFRAARRLLGTAAALVAVAAVADLTGSGALARLEEPFELLAAALLVAGFVVLCAGHVGRALAPAAPAVAPAPLARTPTRFKRRSDGTVRPPAVAGAAR
jgi:hypothetical protein